jgi:hypothetical protein
MTLTIDTFTSTDLDKPYEGSWYTITGCGGDLQEWVYGYNENLAKESIGRPVRWVSTTGEAVNAYARSRARGFAHVSPEDLYPGDLLFLMFPLTALKTGALAMFKLAWHDRWFDDVIDNMVRSVGG